MRKKPSKPTCAEFHALIPELINSGAEIEDVKRHPHVEACNDCYQLLRDLEVIENRARALFPGERKVKPN
jgi:hypothetical protein